MIVLYAITLFITGIYSYALVDPNLTLVNSHLWETFRNVMVHFGYYQRDVSATVYIFLVVFLFIFHFWFVKKYKRYSPIIIALIVGIIFLFSYPFLSHDFFNYMFDAKILTWYHQSPYLYRALDFPKDPWLRFLQWTERTYPYGPVFLLLSAVPSFLAFGKFVIDFILFKAMFVGFYLLSVAVLARMNKKWALSFATHPLVLIEGLISSHNDLISVSLGIVGVYYLLQKSQILSRLFFLLSAGIKYITLPLVFLSKNKKASVIILVSIIIILVYLSIKSEIQPWYLLALFVFLPFYENLINEINIFLAGLLFSYYPYVRFNEWGNSKNIQMKHEIILIFLGLNILYFLAKKIVLKKMKFSPKWSISKAKS